MKKLLYFLSFLLISSVSFASDFAGGSITWQCLPTGKYIFQMEAFRTCSGGAWTYQSEVINIVSSSLPTNGLIAIVMQPDSNRWNSSGAGNLSQQCSPLLGMPFSCANGDDGAIQAYYYVSTPVTLLGTPPQDGWKFYWDGGARDTSMVNVTTVGTGLLRAIMYSDVNGASQDPCFDSSPLFLDNPETVICRGSLYTSNAQVFDEEFDSLAISWGQAIRSPSSNPVSLNYKAGFNQNNPTPGTSVNSSNVSATIDSITKEIKLAVYNGSGVEKYLMVQQIDSYQRKKKIASFFREFPIAIVDCPTFPNGNTNNPPEVRIDGIPRTTMDLEVIAGQEVSIAIQAIDNDLTGITSQPQQLLTMIPKSIYFSQSKTLPDRSAAGVNPCPVNTAEPCAYLRNSSPILDATQIPVTPTLKGLGAINTEFVWQTSCQHIGKRGCCSSTPTTYNFVMEVVDDHCSIPDVSAATLSITVKSAPKLDAPLMVGVSANLDGSASYNWVPPLDTLNQFKKYKVEGARTPNGVIPSNFFSPLDTNLLKYSFSDTTSEFSIFDLVNPLNPNSSVDILSPSGTKLNSPKDFYLRMQTISGCYGLNSSSWSDSVRMIELTASPIGSINSRDSVLLTWNTSGLSDSLNYSNLVSQSKRKYIVYANDSISNGGLAVSNNWYPIGETFDTSFIATSGVCNDYVGFRVEAVDTMIIGNLNYHSIDSLKTVVYSTFSFIDTIFYGSTVPSILNVENKYLKSSIQREKYQWIDCQTGLALPNDTEQVFVPSSPGFYRVVAMGAFCADTSACFEATSIQDSIISVALDYLTTSSGSKELEWVFCNSPFVVLDSAETFIPTSSGSYAVRIQKFGYNSLSQCYIVDDLNIQIAFAGLDSIYSLDSNAKYQWNKGCFGNSTTLVNETEQVYIPKEPGQHFLTLNAYGFSKNSNCFVLNSLNNGVGLFANDSLFSLEPAAKYQWIDCNTGQHLPNGNRRIYALQDTGLYSVVVSAFAYSDTSSCIPMYSVGLSENNFSNNISVFPNPNNGEFTIQFDKAYQYIQVKIRNLQGQLISEKEYSNRMNLELELQGEAGVYFLEMTNNVGEKINVKVLKN